MIKEGIVLERCVLSVCRSAGLAIAVSVTPGVARAIQSITVLLRMLSRSWRLVDGSEIRRALFGGHQPRVVSWALQTVQSFMLAAGERTAAVAAAASAGQGRGSLGGSPGRHRSVRAEFAAQAAQGSPRRSASRVRCAGDGARSVRAFGLRSACGLRPRS